MFWRATDRASRWNDRSSESDLKRPRYESRGKHKSILWLGAGPYLRFFRKLKDTEAIPWGKISKQFKFDDYYRVCKVTFNAWLSVRAKITARLATEPLLEKLPDVQLLLTFFNHDLAVGLFYLPIHKLDPSAAHKVDWTLVLTNYKYHVLGYFKDITRKAHDVAKLTAEMRKIVDENVTHAGCVAFFFTF